MKIKKLHFEYCECGCHGHEANLGTAHYWIYNDLKGNFQLHKGHGWMAPVLGTYTSFTAAKEEAQKHVTQIVKEMLEED